VTTGQTLTTTSSGMSRHDSANSYHHSNYAVITAGLLRDVLVHLLNADLMPGSCQPCMKAVEFVFESAVRLLLSTRYTHH